MANVQQNTNKERGRVQYPSGIKDNTSKPKYNTEVLGDGSGRICGDIQDSKPDDGNERIRSDNSQLVGNIPVYDSSTSERVA